jgi:pimeloyl-ACP methyl ester carboxylesterase
MIWYNILIKGSLPIACPVRLIHGLYDEEVPYQYAYKLAENCATSNVKVTLIKGSSHSMENPIDMRAMIDSVQDLVDTFVGEYDLRSPGSG